MLKDSWKFTRRQYTAYLNTPATLDIDDKGGREGYELALGEAVSSVDAEIVRLIRAMENSDNSPDQQWALQMIQSFPWISGVALVGGDGVVNARYPEYFAKEFDAGPLLEADPKQRPGMLRAYVQMDKSAPEIYVGNPVYAGEEMRGIIVAHFDPAVLASLSPDPGAFSMITPAGVVWPGRFAGGAAAGEDWEAILKERSSGLTGVGESAFFWITRYIGNLPLVYAVPVNAVPGEAPRAPAESPAPAEEKKDTGVAPAGAAMPGDDKEVKDGAVVVRPDETAPTSAPAPGENPALVDTPGAQF
ncbi:MAG: hypothetical protein LBQ51_02675 [Desulfovibrio sp.]|jgi:hypothetical protein|nr:hypothetical protein [Desulfovibrio sp.]